MKIKTYLIIILIISSLASCCPRNRKTIYEYNGIVIKRIEKCNKTIFFYDDFSKNNPRIWAEYSGINSGFSGYLVFESNGKVELIGVGDFYSANLDTSKFEFKHYDLWRPKGDSVYEIYLSRGVEIYWNSKTETKVKAIYKDDYLKKCCFTLPKKWFWN